MNKQHCMRWWAGFGHKLLLAVVSVAAFPSLSFSEAGDDRMSASGRTSTHSGFWVGGGLQYFPHSSAHMWPIQAYPGVQWMYPCFPFVNCAALQQYQKLDRRDRQRFQQPEPVFGPDTPVLNGAMDAWRASLQPAAKLFRTDKRDIQPEFQDHSVIRPEYEGVGDVLPKFPVKENGK
jgi:hypothetical protein